MNNNKNINIELAELINLYLPDRTGESQHITEELERSLSELIYKTDASVDKTNVVALLENKLDKSIFFDMLLSAGTIAVNYKRYNLAVSIYKFLIKQANPESSYSNFSAIAFMELGFVFAKLLRLEESLRNLELANDLFNREMNTAGSIKCLQMIGLIHEDKKDYESAKKYFEKCLSLLTYTRDTSNIGLIEANLGIIHFHQNDYEKSLQSFYRSLLVFEKMSDARRIAELRYNLALIYIKVNEPQMAVTELELSINAAAQCGDRSGLSKAYVSKANVYVDLNDYSLSLGFADYSIGISNTVNDKGTIADAYVLKAKLEKMLSGFNQNFLYNYHNTSLRIVQDADFGYLSEAG